MPELPWGRPLPAASHTVLSRRRASVVKDRQVEPAEARGVGEDVDLDDLASPEGEAHDRKRPSSRNHDDSRGSVHERRWYNGESREKVSVCSATARTPRTSLEKPAGKAPPSMRSTTSGSSTTSSASKSPSREAARKASTASRWQARLASAEVVAPRTRRRARLRVASPRRGAAHDGPDLFEGHGERVVQHEREPLGGR